MGKADLPIPVWLFSWTAAIVLVVSFVALSTLWMRPQLQSEHRKRLFVMPAALAHLASLVGLALFALVLYSGFDGAQVWSVNFDPTFIYVIFWVGFPLASVIFGDIFQSVRSVALVCARWSVGWAARSRHERLQRRRCATPSVWACGPRLP